MPSSNARLMFKLSAVSGKNKKPLAKSLNCVKVFSAPIAGLAYCVAMPSSNARLMFKLSAVSGKNKKPLSRASAGVKVFLVPETGLEPVR